MQQVKQRMYSVTCWSDDFYLTLCDRYLDKIYQQLKPLKTLNYRSSIIVFSQYVVCCLYVCMSNTRLNLLNESDVSLVIF